MNEPIFRDKLSDQNKRGAWGWSIFQITDGHCAYCGCNLDFAGLWHLEHVIPRSQGGRWKGNLIAACERCNLSKGCYMPEQFAEWIVKRLRKTLNRALPDVEWCTQFLGEHDRYAIYDGFYEMLERLADAKATFYHDFTETGD